MKEFLFQLTLIAGLVLGPGAQAQSIFAQVPDHLDVQRVATVTNDRNATETDVYLVVDGDEEIQGLYFDERISALDSSSSGSGLYWAEELDSPRGVAVLQQDGRDVIFLRGQIRNKKARSQLYIRYLSNGLFGNYKECPFGLMKPTEGEPWVLFNVYNGSIVERLHVETWMLGISSIPSICSKQAQFF